MDDFSALAYNRETGVFTWKRHARKNRVGTPAGWKIQGYVRIKVNRKYYLAHRLAWFFEYGEFPEMFIDHINGDGMDNRIANLRLAGYEINSQNKRTAQRNNKCGFLGVSWSSSSNAWRATIKHKGVRTHLGVFKTVEEASAAYIAAKRLLHAGCTI